MKRVEPIRDREDILDMKDYLKTKNTRNYVLFCTGLLLPLRISDILKLKVRDVRNKESIMVHEMKTHKADYFQIHPDLKKILTEYIQGKKDYEYLFPSQMKNKRGIHGPIGRNQAYKILTDAANQFGLEKIGCHSLRKTFGYHYYKETGDIVGLKKLFNHADIETTEQYIGINTDYKANIIKSVSLF